jgi:hypothetical protein
MKGPALLFALIAVASVVGFAAYTKERSAETIVSKTAVLAKDQARIPPEGCLLGVRDILECK